MRTLPHALSAAGAQEGGRLDAAAAITALEFEAGTAPGMASGESLGFSSNSLVVAVGAEAAVKTVGVRVLRSKIQDVQDNRTRFLVLASEPLPSLLATNSLPASLSRLYSASAQVGMVGRSLLGVRDAVSSDLVAESGSYSDSPSVLDRVVPELSKCTEVSIRKVDRRRLPWWRHQVQAAYGGAATCLSCSTRRPLLARQR